jgi:hypothetical protein
MICVGVPQPFDGRCWNKPRLSLVPDAINGLSRLD